ncbi:MAG TPA: DmsC/YnfH family molybdoenzyme membrane anchor subunit [Sulfuricaulis sp.]|nr:dimethyl sulfoxide reductase anchor subunit [Gammaproteobacteria bacterium]HEU5338332.1 DmsC/YnfH family molybdoenzyme membrane anchor subunit [Sulfuricaulis sp.]MDH3370275.1 dimethyl sulfoxide reductase anchor subunit [Gammaproteobacteria bacterium]MDH3405354.1 dimethyl sulfoxide reductase anchor subunit [Gammaproteobacteria bacterium]MDH3562404.1 dimethyl sulfoxide reductase anchor subunit [Gammaproteobacteria bacterium]
MHPAFSVIFLTTLIGAGQGLFLALYTAQVYSTVELLPVPPSHFYVQGSAIALALLIGGLVASFFHLGHPERAWRSAARWRTSWLSREVIVLPALMGAVAVYGVVHHLNLRLKDLGFATSVDGDLALVVGAAAVALAFLLFLCTGMIYACIKFLQEWASWLTVVNYTLFGLASGFLLATAYAAYQAPALVYFFGAWTVIITLAVWVTRAASLIRNRRLKYKSTIQTAIGVRHARIVQKSQGFMGGSFNTRDFFHGAAPWLFRSIKWVFLVLVFPVPLVLLFNGMVDRSVPMLSSAFVIQYLGLLAERWYFFAQANHPQNIYYQTIS